MYFGRNAYDPTAVAEAQTRLQAFQGATSISSSQYFGRSEEEELGGSGSSADGMLGDNGLERLEYAAKDAIARVLANPEVQNVGESIRAGALKVSVFFVLFPHTGLLIISLQLSEYLAQMSER